MASVFLIDDDPMFANSARHRLELDGHRVDCNYGAFGALTAARQASYDFILVDVKMPDIEGPKLVELLRNRGVGSARVYLVSSISENELKRAALTHGAHGYFCKQWGLDRLAGIVDPTGAASKRPPQTPGRREH